MLARVATLTAWSAGTRQQRLCPAMVAFLLASSWSRGCGARWTNPWGSVKRGYSSLVVVDWSWADSGMASQPTAKHCRCPLMEGQDRPISPRLSSAPMKRRVYLLNGGWDEELKWVSSLLSAGQSRRTTRRPTTSLWPGKMVVTAWLWSFIPSTRLIQLRQGLRANSLFEGFFVGVDGGSHADVGVDVVGHEIKV